MIGRKKIFIILFVLPLFIFMASEEESHRSRFIEFLGKSVNFIILFAGLFFLLFKPLRSFLEGRCLKADRSIKDAQVSKEEAEKELQEIEARMSRLEEEIAEIKKQGEIEGRKEKERIIEVALQEAQRIKHFTKIEIDVLIQAGVQELKEYTSELATSLAQERIKKKMTSEKQSFFIDKSIDRLERLYEKSSFDKKIHSRVS